MQWNQGAGWYDQPLDEITAALHTDEVEGLAAHEAAERLHQWGPNELRQGQAISPLTLLAGQFRSLVIWVLIGAAIVSIVLGEVVDGVAILAIVFLNAVIGFFQEYRAEQAVAALARLTAPRARVVRGGRTEVIAAAEVVCGDLLLLDAGDLVAADARLVAAAMFRTNEAPLTGESQPVEKQTGICAPETPLAERHNMVFLGTNVASGSGRALVVATGMHTEVGRIASLLETASSDATPLQSRLDQVAPHLLRAFGARSERHTVWHIGLFSNRQLCVIVTASFALQLAISQLPALQQLFGITPISLRQWSAWIVLGAVPLLVLELQKMFSHAYKGDDTAPC
jgi:P-type Ca2+ transporter type 2C